MRALATNSRGFTTHVAQQDLSILDTLDLDLFLLSGLEIQGCDAFELIFLSHVSAGSCECAGDAGYWTNLSSRSCGSAEHEMAVSVCVGRD